MSASLDLHNASYVDGSATCPAVSGTTLDLQLGDVGPAGSAACRFLARVTTAATEVLLDDDFESGLTSWAVTSPAGPDQWSAVSTDSHSPNNSAFAIDSITTSDQQMTTTSPITMGTSTVLRFWHRYDFENRYDGGVVEISEDGGTTWVGTQNLFVSGGYPTSLFSTSNPLSGRPAFTGDSGGWKESVLSLDPYQGFDLMFRFRVGTDASVGAPGWWVDDVRLANEVGAIVSGTATASTPATTSQPAQLQTEIHEGGLLRVTTDPPVPSQITLDGVRMNRWGLNWLRVAPGSYELCFSDVIDWTAPPCQTVVIEDGTTTTAVGTFSQRGFLRVETSPPVPSTITIDGEPADDWGLWIDIDPGNYEVCFGAVADYATPPCQQVTVSAGALETVTGSFTPQPGSPGPAGHGLLRATTSPALPSMISINGNPADRWGLDWVKLAPGSYDVCFSDIHLYVAPDCRTVEVVAGQVTATEGVFEQLGDLRVVTAPPQPSTIYVDGLPRDAWGLWTDLPVGDHIVCFEGWAGFTPPCETTTLTALNTTIVEGTWP
ncbi:MAG: immune inhibitor A [Acidimicrobiales bacterium]|nr:immune inhibitor A [Acidimicrobiales bacterium]